MDPLSNSKFISFISEPLPKFWRNSKWLDVVFLVTVLIMCWTYGFWDLRDQGPRGLHQWRQSDCLSITQNYYKEDLPFLEPAMHYAGPDGTGKTISEFPIIYYSIANIWKVFGKNEGLYRGIVLLYFLIALFALYRTISSYLDDRFLGLWVATLLFTSPMLVFYSSNFLANVPALSSALIGWAFFYKYIRKTKVKWLIVSFLFFTLGGLLKASAALSFVALFFVFLLYLTGLFSIGTKGRSRRRARHLMTAFAASFVILTAWYFYAHSYNSANNKGIFLIGILPIWELNGQEMDITLSAIKEHLRWDYFRVDIYYMLIGFAVCIAMFLKQTDRFLSVLLSISLIGAMLFVLLFFQALQEHDYYVLDLLILMPLITLTFLMLAKTKCPKALNSWIVRLTLIVLIIHNADFAQRRMEWRYSGWMDEGYSQYTYKFREVENILRRNGIERDDLVISLPDPSFNSSLYAMDQKGWSGFKEFLMDSVKVKEKIVVGASVLIITDTLANDPHIIPFTKKPLAEHDGLLIYDLRDY